MITFLGDVALISDNLTSQYKPSFPYIINFEYVTGTSKLNPVPGKINIFSPNHNFEKIFGVNPIAANVANNHILDYGTEGYNETIEILTKNNIPTIGDRAFVFNGVHIFAYTMFNGYYDKKNIVQFDKEKVLADIKNAQENGAKRIIVNIHWGIENHPLQNITQQDIGHWLIDNGVDFVVGSHPHCIQPIEKYKEKYIVYSLGNCLFPAFSLNSHFDENGISQRKYRFKWQYWNRKSLAVTYDENTNTLAVIDELYQKKNILLCTRSNVAIEKYTSVKNKQLAKYIYLLRKYFLFFASNFCVDGKLFDMQAIIAERRKSNG